MIVNMLKSYCEECPYIDVEVNTKRGVDENGEVRLIKTNISCKNYDVCKRIYNIAKEESVHDNPIVKVECSTCESFLSGDEDCLGYCKRFNMRECHQNGVGCVAYKPKR